MKPIALKFAARVLLRHAPLAAGVLTAVLGSAGLALWHLQASVAVTWAANIGAMPHHASTALLLCGLALGASTFGAARLTAGLAILTILLAANNLAGQVFDHADLLEAAFVHRYGAPAVNLPWAMPTANAVAFLLAALALMLTAIPRGTSRRPLVVVLTLLSLPAGLPAPGSLTAPDTATTGEHLASLLPALGGGHLLLAAGLLCFAYRRNTHDKSSPLGWVATVVVAGQFALTLLLWNGLELIIGERQDRHLSAETTAFGQRFTEALQMRITALERMARRWELGGGTPRNVWTADATGYVADLQGLQALQWANVRGQVRWVVPERGNEAAIGLDNAREPVRLAMLERADGSPIPVVTGPVDLVQGGRGLLITRALKVGGRPDGYLVAVFRVDEFLQTLSHEIVSLDFGLDVTLGGQSVFRRGAAPLTSRARARTQDFVINGDAGWQFRIWPGEAVLQRGPFSDLFLASGVAMTLLVAVAFWFWGRNAHAARQLKEANQALSAERNFVAGLIDNTNALSIVMDPDGRIVRFNHACEELTGHTAEEMLGKCFWDVLMPPAEAARASNSFTRLVARGHNGRFEGSCLAKDGRTYQIAWSNSVLAGPDDRPRHVMSVGIDITERQRAADALLAAKDEADRANRAKSEFLSSMSHELRTPMNAVLGFAQLISMDPQLAPTHRESVAQILKAGDLLLHLINDILNLARIESGRIELAAGAVACGELIADCIGMVAPLALRNAVEIRTTGEADIVVHADRQFMRQILLNLLSNAIKYNRHAGQVGIHSGIGADGELRLVVSDTGTGIAPELQAHLFEPFNRLGAQNGSIEGTGIGLVVCKRLIEAMGGTIHVASEPGHGSTFTITLPGAHPGAAEEEGVAAARMDEGTPAQRTVLQIVDDESGRRLLHKILATLPNVRVVHAPRPDVAMATTAGSPPDLVIMDIPAPGADYGNLLDELRCQPALRDRPVVALGTGGSERDIVEARAAGFSEYLSQPIDVARLRKVAMQLLDASRCPVTPPSVATANSAGSAP